MRFAFWRGERNSQETLQALCNGQPCFKELTTPAVVGQELQVEHSLGRFPIGWTVVKGDRTVAGDSLPVGTIIDLGHAALPSGFLLCDGSNKNIADYSDLATALGTTWGTPGAGLFTLPALARRTRVGSGGAGTGTLGNAVGNTGGAETHTLVIGEMPAHAHDAYYESTEADNGATEDVPSAAPGNGSHPTSTVGGGGAHNNVQPSAIVTMAIKYAPTQASLANTTAWDGRFIYLKFAVASAPLTIAIF